MFCSWGFIWSGDLIWEIRQNSLLVFRLFHWKTKMHSVKAMDFWKRGFRQRCHLWGWPYKALGEMVTAGTQGSWRWRPYVWGPHYEASQESMAHTVGCLLLTIYPGVLWSAQQAGRVNLGQLGEMHVLGKNLNEKPRTQSNATCSGHYPEAEPRLKGCLSQGTEKKSNGFRRMSWGKSELFPDVSQNCCLDPKSGSVLGTQVTITTINK